MDREGILQQRCDALEAEQKRVTAQLEAITRKLADLDQGQIEILERMTKNQEASIGFDKELLGLFKAIVDTDGIEGLTREEGKGGEKWQ